MRGLLLLPLLAACDAGGVVEYVGRPPEYSRCEVPDPEPHIAAGCAHAAEIPDVFPVDRSGERRGGDATPRGIHLAFPADPSTTIAFSWRTDLGTCASQVELGTSDAVLDQTALGWTFVGTQGMPGNANFEERRLHEVHVCGLLPGTQYWYRVGGPDAWSEVHTFRTAPATGEDAAITFAVIGDTRSGWKIWEQIAAAIDGFDPAFVVHTGDAVVSGDRLTEWDWHFDDAGGLYERAPLVFVNGNHERDHHVAHAEIVAPGNEMFYELRYGPLHFIGLDDTPAPGGQEIDEDSIAGEQADFLEEVLCSTDARWRFAAHHRPPFCSGGNWGSAEDVREAWAPVFDACGLDIDFAGHEHLYERTLPIFESARANGKERGTVYTVVAGGGAPLYPVGPPEDWRAVIEKVHSFAIVEVSGGTLDWTAYALDCDPEDPDQCAFRDAPLDQLTLSER